MIDRFSLLNCVTVALLLGLLTACSDRSGESGRSGSSDSVAPDSLPASFENRTYGVMLRHPEAWRIWEGPHLDGTTYAISVYRAAGDSLDLPFGPHADGEISHVSVWPGGLGVDLPRGEVVRFAEADSVPDLQFEVDGQESRIFRLEDGSAWGWFIVPRNPPSNWDEFGFIFAQAATEQMENRCLHAETGASLPMEECSRPTDHRYILQGRSDPAVRDTVQQILASIELTEGSQQSDRHELIRITDPNPGDTVTSPLDIRGEARGYWFFEGDFPVRLYDGGGNLVVETYATAQGEWMTEEYVSFESSLTFSGAEAGSGRLVLYRDNPSGLPENADSLVIPVHFTGE